MASTNTPSSGGGSSHRKRLSAGAPTIMPTKRSKVATIWKLNQTTDTGTANAKDAAIQPGLVTAKPPKIGKRILDAEIQLGLVVRGSGPADAQEQRLQSMIKTIHAIQAIPCPLQSDLSPCGRLLHDAAVHLWPTFGPGERLWWITIGQHYLYITHGRKSETLTGTPLARSTARSATKVPPWGLILIQIRVWGYEKVSRLTWFGQLSQTETIILGKIHPLPPDAWKNAVKDTRAIVHADDDQDQADSNEDTSDEENNDGMESVVRGIITEDEANAERESVIANTNAENEEERDGGVPMTGDTDAEGEEDNGEPPTGDTDVKDEEDQGDSGRIGMKPRAQTHDNVFSVATGTGDSGTAHGTTDQPGFFHHNVRSSRTRDAQPWSKETEYTSPRMSWSFDADLEDNLATTHLPFGNRQDRDSNLHPDPASGLSNVQAHNPPPLAETSNKSLADPIEFTRNPSSATVAKSHFDSQPKVDQSPLIRNPNSEISYAWWQQRAIWKWVKTQYHKDAQFAHIKDFICQCGIPQEDPDRAVVSFWLYWTERKRTTTSMAKFGEWMRLANEICSSDSKIPMSAAKRLAATHLGGCQEDWNLEEVLHRWMNKMSCAPDKSQ